MFKRLKTLWYLSGLDVDLPETKRFIPRLINRNKAEIVEIESVFDRIKL